MSKQPRLDALSISRLRETVTFAHNAAREARDLAIDAPMNPGLEGLEELAAASEDALDDLYRAAAKLARLHGLDLSERRTADREDA